MRYVGTYNTCNYVWMLYWSWCLLNFLSFRCSLSLMLIKSQTTCDRHVELLESRKGNLIRTFLLVSNREHLPNERQNWRTSTSVETIKFEQRRVICTKFTNENLRASLLFLIISTALAQSQKDSITCPDHKSRLEFAASHRLLVTVEYSLKKFQRSVMPPLTEPQRQPHRHSLPLISYSKFVTVLGRSRQGRSSPNHLVSTRTKSLGRVSLWINLTLIPRLFLKDKE